MYIEKRVHEKTTKYYIVNSYRDKKRVRKIRKYLGQNLDNNELNNRKSKAGQQILNLLEETNTEILLFKLTRNQVEQLNRFDNKIRFHHLDTSEGKRFTEEFVYSTNAIEGSTVQRGDVSGILDKQNVSGAEEQETKGAAKAIDFVKSAKMDISI